MNWNEETGSYEDDYVSPWEKKKRAQETLQNPEASKRESIAALIQLVNDQADSIRWLEDRVEKLEHELGK